MYTQPVRLHGQTKHDTTVVNMPIENTYTGDSTANRAITHGFGRIPKIVLIYDTGTTAGGLHFIFSDYAAIKTGINTIASLAVTAIDATYFYVGNATNYGNSGNLTGITYRWACIG